MRLLIVDDELYTREGLKEEIDWKKLGINEILDASDGKAAQDMLNWFRPDLVITDIRMPNMDGLSFAEKLHEKCPGAQLLFMSGYMEIDYFRKALKLSAVDFIEKPLDMDEVSEAVQKALDVIRKERKKESDWAQSREAREERLVNYLKIRKTDRKLVTDLCRQVNFPTEGIYFCVLIRDEEKSDKVCKMLSEIRDFFSERRLHAITAVQPGYSYLTILAGKNENIIGNRRMLEQLKQRLGGVQISIGFPAWHLGAVCESCRLAQEAMNLAFFRDGEQEIWEVREMSRKPQMLDTSIYSRMQQSLIEYPAQLPAIINTVMENIRSEANVDPQSVKHLAKLFAADMIEEYPYLDQYLAQYLCGITLQEYIEDCMSLRDLQTLLLELAGKIGGKESEMELSPVIRSIYRYIASSINEPELSLQRVSDHIGLSVTHISTLFRKEAHMTIRQYIEQCRIEQAKQLLRQQKKITEVARLCGYSQANYFVRVFKQETGLTPGEFRKNALSEK